MSGPLFIEFLHKCNGRSLKRGWVSHGEVVLCWGLVEQVSDEYKKQYIIDVLLLVPKERDTIVVPSELNKMGNVKRINEPPKHIS